MLGRESETGAECTLLLKHRKGKITTILTSTSTRILEPKVSPSTHKESSNQADKKKTVRKKRNSKKRLETLLSFQRHLVEEKGLPPSRLMLQHDAASPAQSFQAESINIEHFKCDHREYTTYSKHGLSVHMGYRHKKHQKPDIPYDEASSVFLESTVPSRILRCTFCRERFESKEMFFEHTGIEFVGWNDQSTPYHVKCPLCDIYASNCYSVKKHMEEKHNRHFPFTVK